MSLGNRFTAVCVARDALLAALDALRDEARAEVNGPVAEAAHHAARVVAYTLTVALAPLINALAGPDSGDVH